MRGFPVSGPALTPPCSLGTAAPPAQSSCLLRRKGRDQPLLAAWSRAKARGAPEETPRPLSTAAPARGPQQHRLPGPRSLSCGSSWARTCLTRRPRAPNPREPRRPPRRLRDRRARPQESPVHSHREPPRHLRPLRGPLGHLLSLQRAPCQPPRGPGQQPGGPLRSWLRPQHCPRRTPAPRRPPRCPSGLAHLLVPPPGSQQPLRPPPVRAPGSLWGRRQRRRKPSCERGHGWETPDGGRQPAAQGHAGRTQWALPEARSCGLPHCWAEAAPGGVGLALRWNCSDVRSRIVPGPHGRLCPAQGRPAEEEAQKGPGLPRGLCDPSSPD